MLLSYKLDTETTLNNILTWLETSKEDAGEEELTIYESIDQKMYLCYPVEHSLEGHFALKFRNKFYLRSEIQFLKYQLFQKTVATQ